MSKTLDNSVDMVEWTNETGDWKQFKFVDFPPGSVLLLETSPDPVAANSIDCLSSALNLGLDLAFSSP